eukprot:5282836-Pleurochrysis_carterae.AAC.1
MAGLVMNNGEGHARGEKRGGKRNASLKPMEPLHLLLMLTVVIVVTVLLSVLWRRPSIGRRGL